MCTLTISTQRGLAGNLRWVSKTGVLTDIRVLPQLRCRRVSLRSTANPFPSAMSPKDLQLVCVLMTFSRIRAVPRFVSCALDLGSGVGRRTISLTSGFPTIVSGRYLMKSTDEAAKAAGNATMTALRIASERLNPALPNSARSRSEMPKVTR